MIKKEYDMNRDCSKVEWKGNLPFFWLSLERLAILIKVICVKKKNKKREYKSSKECIILVHLSNCKDHQAASKGLHFRPLFQSKKRNVNQFNLGLCTVWVLQLIVCIRDCMYCMVLWFASHIFGYILITLPWLVSNLMPNSL